MLKDEKKPEAVVVEEVKPVVVEEVKVEEEVKPVEEEVKEAEEVKPVEEVKEEEVKEEEMKEETAAESEGVWSYISNTFWWLLGYKN